MPHATTNNLSSDVTKDEKTRQLHCDNEYFGTYIANLAM